MCTHTHTHTPTQTWHGPSNLCSNILIMNSLAWIKYSRVSDNKFYHPHHLIEIIQGIMESSFLHQKQQSFNKE